MLNFSKTLVISIIIYHLLGPCRIFTLGFPSMRWKRIKENRRLWSECAQKASIWAIHARSRKKTWTIYSVIHHERSQQRSTEVKYLVMAVIAPVWALTHRVQFRPSHTYKCPDVEPVNTTSPPSSPRLVQHSMGWRAPLRPKIPGHGRCTHLCDIAQESISTIPKRLTTFVHAEYSADDTRGILLPCSSS